MHKKGLVIGKFLPPHKGHEYLFKFAAQYCEHLTIVVDCVPGQTISPIVRKQWIEKIMPQANVVALEHDMPQEPNECEDFWQIWKEALYKAVGEKPDILVAAMDYGWQLSQTLNCDFVPCDIARESVPISATQIRDNPLEHWKYIIDPAKPYFMKKICLVGPESTGKTTTAIALAEHLDSVFIPEYAKALIVKQQGAFHYDNVEQVALAQIRSEKALEHMVNKVMICDSDPITTMVWSEVLFGKFPSILHTLAQEQHYDLTLLFDPKDTLWVNDQHRQLLSNPQDKRQEFFYRLQDKLEYYKRNYAIVKGDYQQKYHTCIDVINTMIKTSDQHKYGIKKKV